MLNRRKVLLTAGSVAVLGGRAFAQQSTPPGTDPLSAWNEGQAKAAIVEFVDRVTRAGSSQFIPVSERIATFDNDGTLWPENPMPFELAFAVDVSRAQTSSSTSAAGSKTPDRSAKQPRNRKQVIEDLVLATHTGSTIDQFNSSVRNWIESAVHPTFKVPYTALAYQPMLQVLNYLRAYEFKTFIVSGGGATFMRVFAERVYGIPPEQVIGTLFKTKFSMVDDKPVLTILPQIVHVDDRAGKPVAIQQIIGRRPIAAFGNSDGDLEMLQLTTISHRPSLGMIIHHTDGDREWAYDRHPASSGRLSAALDEAPRRGWIIVDMKRDWNTVFKSVT